MRDYTPRGMPAKFMDGAPKIVKDNIIDIIAIKPAKPLDYDICFRSVEHGEMAGLDFGKGGSRGCHFFLKTYEMRAYRERNRKNRTAWLDLPQATQAAILSYLIED